MTSANVIEYRIFHLDGTIVGHHRQNIMCTNRWWEVLKYAPIEDFKIQAYGYDENEEYWEDKIVPLKQWIKDNAKNDSPTKIEEGEWWCAGWIIQENKHPRIPAYSAFKDTDGDQVGHPFPTRKDASYYAKTNPNLKPSRTPTDYGR